MVLSTSETTFNPTFGERRKKRNIDAIPRALKSLDDWLNKESKKYLSPGEKAPEGKELHTGQRGGKYYLGDTEVRSRWKSLHQEKVKLSPKGIGDLEQVTGHSKNFLENKIRRMAREYGTSPVAIDNARRSVLETLDFLDFYIRLANDPEKIENSELNLMSKRILGGYQEHLDSLDKHGDFAQAKKIKGLLGGGWYNTLKYGDRSGKVLSIDKFVSVNHSIEPTIIPHIFGVEFIGVRIPLQSYIVEIFDYLAENQGTLEKSFQKIRTKNRADIEKEVKKVLVHPKDPSRKPFYRTIDTEHMRDIGKLGFAATSRKIADMIRDPNSDAEDVGNLARWFARRIKSTTTTYRSQWWREFRSNLKEGENREAASKVASAFISELSGHE